MPLYYFDIENGRRAWDIVGAELSNDQAAKQEAMLRALDNTGHQLDRYRGFGVIVVRKEDGEEIFRRRIGRSSDPTPSA
jgi:hypothetical protein